MKYNGKELIEMTPEYWDGKTREMLVWDGWDEHTLRKLTLIGYDSMSKNWITSYPYKGWHHCAEIPKEEPKIEIKPEYDFVENMLKTAAKDQHDCIILPKRAVEQMSEIEKACSIVYKENEELKARIKTLLVDRGKMANAVSGAVWKELMDRAAKYESLIGVQMPTGFGFNDISDIVLNKIIDYKLENKPEKKIRVMTNKELAEWLAKGNGVWAWSNYATGVVKDSTTHKTIWEYRNENADEPCTTNLENRIRIKGWDETNWREPIVEE